MEPAEIGRYQVGVPINGDATALLIDAFTGQSWVLGRKNDRTWHDLNFAEAKNGHQMLTPPPCTQDNPTCYFSLPQSGDKPPAAKNPAEGESMQ